MDTPQEIVVWYVLPALRKEYVLAFKILGRKQKEISEIMGITEAAVSQYMKNKRGNSILFSDDVKKNILASAKSILSGSHFKKEFQISMKKIKNKGVVCSICKEHIDAEKGCRICF